MTMRVYNYIGGLYFNQKEYSQAAEWYTKAAEKGNSTAENNIGDMYYYGKGVQQDYKKAIEWYTKAAEKGNSTAENNIGHMYYYGKGVQQDYKKAIEWYTKAAEKGDANAYNNFAWTLHLINEHEKALPWAEKAYKELPNKSDIIDTLATIYQELNRKEEALDLFELCLKLQKEQQEDEEFQNETIEKIKKLKDILR